jgi:uncharacterized protein YeaO (DUF488 family)
MPILVKRAYEKPSKDDGTRVLVERAWPRGLGKSTAMLDLWLPILGPSEGLEDWLQSGDPMKSRVQRKYFAELSSPEAMAALEMLHSFAAKPKPLTLLYSGRDADLSPAQMLKQLLEGGKKPPTGSGPGRAAAGGGQLRAIRKAK